MTPNETIAYRIRERSLYLWLTALVNGKDCTREQAQAEAARQIAREQAEQRAKEAPAHHPESDDDDILTRRLKDIAARMTSPPAAGASLGERWAWAAFGKAPAETTDAPKSEQAQPAQPKPQSND
jgi:hypothetical protein